MLERLGIFSRASLFTIDDVDHEHLFASPKPPPQQQPQQQEVDEEEEERERLALARVMQAAGVMRPELAFEELEELMLS